MEKSNAKTIKKLEKELAFTKTELKKTLEMLNRQQVNVVVPLIEENKERTQELLKS